MIALLVLLQGIALAEAAAPQAPPCAEAWADLIPRAKHRFDYHSDRDYAEYASRVNRRACVKDWTVLIYMAADNDLTPYAYWDLYEIEAGFPEGAIGSASSMRSDVVVQLDTAGSAGLKRLHLFEAPELYEPARAREDFEKRTEKDIRSPVVMTLEERGEAEASKLKRFLEWGIREYPARHYMVIVWGHGQGWRAGDPPVEEAQSRYLDAEDLRLMSLMEPAPAFERRFGGLAFNDTHGSSLDIPSLRAVLEEVSAEFLGGEPIDVYASDACLMQMAEVANEIAGTTRFVIGSTDVQSFLGLPYRRILQEINRGSFAGEKPAVYGRSDEIDEPFLVARMLPKVFRSALNAHGIHGRFDPEGARRVTMSAISSSELKIRLLPALDAFGRAMEAYISEDPLRIIDIQFVLQKAPSVQGGAQEIGVFATLVKLLIDREAENKGELSRSAELLFQAASAVQAGLSRTVVAHALGTDYTKSLENQYYLLGFRAFSVWLPVSEKDYANRIGDFERSRLYRESPGWRRWLDRAFGVSEN